MLCSAGLPQSQYDTALYVIREKEEMLQFPLYSGYKRLLEALSYDHSLELFSYICAKLISLYG